MSTANVSGAGDRRAGCAWQGIVTGSDPILADSQTTDRPRYSFSNVSRSSFDWMRLTGSFWPLLSVTS